MDGDFIDWMRSLDYIGDNSIPLPLIWVEWEVLVYISKEEENKR